MIQHPNTNHVSTGAEATAAPEKNWQLELIEHLQRAAATCVEHGVDVDNFMRAAWNAYLEARPGMREYIEEQQLRGQLDAIRQAGKMGLA